MLRRHTASLFIRFALVVTVLACLLPVSSAAFNVTRTSNTSDHLISTKVSTNFLGGMYAGYLVQNNDPVTYDNVWVTLDSFTGGFVDLGVGETGLYPLGQLIPGQSKMVYFYLTATTVTATTQSHTLHVYDNRPDIPTANELHSELFSFPGVDTSIAASANKIDVVISGPDPATLGGIITMEVEGRTGTVGAGNVLEVSPAGDLTWPASSYRLKSAEVTFLNISGSNCGTTVLGVYTDQLEIPWSTTSCYRAVYEFAAAGSTSQPTAVTPMVHVASGTQIKHTTPTGFADLPPIPQVTLELSVAKSANPASLTTAGVVTYTVTATNSASNVGCPAGSPNCNDALIEDFTDVLPATPGSATYVVGSAQYGGSPIPDPSITGSTLTWVGSFSVPAGSSVDLTYQVNIPEEPGVYTNNVVAHVGITQIDTTLDPDDDAPATSDVDQVEIPVIGIAKDAAITGTGPFTVTLDFYLENFGNVDLSNVQITDDLNAAFGIGNYSISVAPSIVADPGLGLTANAGFNGAADQNLLAAGSSLPIGQTAQVQVAILVTAAGNFTNSATVGGDPPSGAGNRVTDDSVDGTNADPDDNDDPTDDTLVTLIDLPENAVIGVSKDASVTGSTVTLDFYLENFGNVDLSNVQITDDLNAAFGIGNYSISVAPSIVADPGAGLTANAGFNGAADQNLLAVGSSLDIGNTAQVQVVVSVTAPGSYTNAAVAAGDPPSGAGNRVSDNSVDGTNADPDDNDDPTDDTSNTPIVLAEIPIIGVAKDAAVSGTGPFTVTLDFYLENFGNVDLANVQITDDLNAAFGIGNYSISVAPSIAADPGLGLTANAGFNGAADQNLLAAGSALDIGQTAQVQVTVSVTAPGSYNNSAIAAGDPPSGAGNRVTDSSVDGTNADPDNNDDPTDDTSDTPIDLAETPVIGVAKDAAVSGTGPFTVTLDFYLENFGNVDLANVQVTDDLNTAFGIGNFSISVAPSIVADPGAGLTANAGFNGVADQNLLAAGSSLPVGQTAQVQVTVSVTAPGSYNNSATAGGDPPSGPGNRVNDDSVDGTNADPDDNDDPTDDTSDTPIDLAETPVIGVAKDASITGSGPFTVTLDFYLENFGNVDLANVQITDDLNTAFGIGNYSISVAPSIVADPGLGLTANAGFNGAADQNLLAAGSSLNIGNTAQVQVAVSVTTPGSYTNAAVAAGDPPSGAGNRVSDNSVDGTNSDPDDNDDPTDDMSDTPIVLAELPLIGVAKDAAVSGTGPFTVTLDFYLENFGNVALSNVQITDDLNTAFGVGNYSISVAPSIVADPGLGLTANAGFNGAADQNLLAAGSSLGIGNTAQVQVTVSVTAPGSYTNSALAGGDPPSGAGNRVSDNSVDGTNADPDDNDDPTDDMSDTPIDLAELPLIGVAKDAAVSGTGPFTVTLDFYLENFGNVDLANVQITDDLNTAFGIGNYSISVAPSIVADPGLGLTANAGFNGAADQNLLAAGSSLDIGQTAQVQVVVSVTAPGSYTNAAVAAADPPSGAGNRVTDSSVDGTNADPDDNDDPTDDTSDTPIDLAETPIIGVAKDAAVAGTGPFTVTLDFYLENFGNVDLANVQITDDLNAAFGIGNYSISVAPSIVADPGAGLTANAGFNGAADQNLLAAGSSLGISNTAQVQVTVSVTAPGSYTNSAVAGGDPPSGPGNRTTDDSVDGTNADPDGNDIPGDNTSDTPIDLGETARIGVAKDAAVSGTGPFTVTLDFYLENFGNVALSNVQVTDNLNTAFGAGNYSISVAPSIVADPGAGLTANAGFNGAADQNLLAAGSSLGIGNTAQVQVTVSVTAPGSYTNSAVAGGDPPSGPGNRVTDDSVDGTNADPDDNDDPTDDTSDTPINLTETPIIGVAKDASITGSGPFTVTLDFYLENFGNVALSNVQVTDNLNTAFGIGNYSISVAPSIVADPGLGLTANAGFNGAADQNLLAAGSSLPVGQTAQMQVTVSVTAPGSYTNSALAGGDPPSGAGNRVNDNSVDGTNADPDDNNDPTDDTSDTPINLTETPIIGVAKDASITGSGPFTVTLDFYLENFGNVDLSNVQITDDLNTAFGIGNYSISVAPSIVADPGLGLTANAGFNGAADQNLLAAGSSLPVGQTAQVQVVVSVTAPGSYTNTATAGGDPPSGAGNRVTDDSVDGTNADPDDNDDPTDDTSDTPIDLAETPIIGVAKDASITGSGPFTVTLDFYLENFGNVDLSNVQITDDLNTAFGIGNYSISVAPSIVADPGLGLTANAGFNGAADQNLLAAGSSLDIGQTAQVQVVVSVTAPGSYTNAAVAAGDPPSGAGNRVSDNSVDGTNADPDDNDDPTDDTSDTPIDLAETPLIGVAKDAAVSGTGPFTVTLDFYLENFGNVDLSNVQITDDLNAAFGIGNYSISVAPSIVADPGLGLTANAGFNGAADQNLLAAGSSLPVGQTAQVQVVVSVTAPGNYNNSATAGGNPPSGPGNRVTDDSVDGTNADPDDNDDPTDDTSDTPIDLAETPIIGVAKDASITGSGPFTVTLDFYLENFGNVDLSNVQITDDLNAAFGIGNYTISVAPSIVADPGLGLTANAGFNGGADQNLLAAGSSLPVGQTAQVQVTVSVTAPGSYTNAAVAAGDPPSGPGNRVTDDSVDGTNADPDDNDDPTDDTSDTPIDLAETPIIGVAKDASFTGTGPFAVTLDFYLENFGNVDLSNVQITDDLNAAFGIGNYSISVAPSIVADPGLGLTANAGFNGAADQNLLAAGSSLDIGQTAQVQVVVSVTAPGSYTNAAVAAGDPPSGPGNRVNDDSVDGTNADPDDNDDPTDDTSDTPIDLAETPIIGVAKDASFTGTGPFAVTLDFYLENFGNVDLSNVQITDDLNAAFGIGNYSISVAPSIVADPGLGLTANAGFNGAADQNLLAAGSSLGIGNTAQVQVVVSVNVPGTFINTAVAAGDPPSGPGNRVTDDSVDGTNADPDDNDDPTDDTSDTPINLTETPIIGVAKDASITGSGPFTVTLDFYLENFGNVDLSNVQITDDLNTAFGIGNYSISVAPSIVADPGAGLTANAGFNGAADQNLLAAGSSLPVGQTAQVQVVVSVTAPGNYNNSATAGGNPPSGPGNRVTDDSVSGTNADPDDNDDPTDDISDTPINLSEAPSIGVAKTAAVSGTGPFTVTLDFYLENFGDVALSNVQVTDDLDAAFGAGNYSISVAPSIAADPGGGLSANAGFNGAADQNLLGAGSSLGTGNAAQMQVVVSVTAPGSYTNSATAGGDPPSGAGNRVTDDSVDGANADPDGNDDPSDDSSDTPIDLLAPATIMMQKDAGRDRVSVGEMIGYTLTVENLTATPVPGLDIRDAIPAGFRYVAGSGLLVRTGLDLQFGTPDDVTAPMEPTGSRVLLFEDVDLAANETVRISYLLRVGTGVTASSYVNTAVTLLNDVPISAEVRAAVEVLDDEVVDRTTIIGKVFHDRDGDGWQDAALATGLTVSMDDEILEGSLEIDTGTGFEPVEHQDLRQGIELGALPGNNRVVLMARLLGPIQNDLLVRTAEGSALRIDGAGKVTAEHGGKVRRGMTAQQIEADLSMAEDAGTTVLVLTLVNTGLDEPGIPGVRVVTTGGLLVETDPNGRFHIADVDGGRWERGRNAILKVDPATLSPGARFTTENPRVVRITRGLMNRINFGVKLPPQELLENETVVEEDFGELFFDYDEDHAGAETDRLVATLVDRFKGAAGGNLLIEGHTEQRDVVVEPESREYGFTGHFGVLEATLAPRDREELRTIANAWSDAIDVNIKAIGHTSDVRIAPRSRHIFPDNYALSEARARAVADYLQSLLNLPPENIITAGRGPDQPVADNTTAAGRSRNRRIELHISGHIPGEVPDIREGMNQDYDMGLSMSRANNVMKAAAASGLPEEIETELAAYGQDRPRSDNDTEAGRRDNRRVDVSGSMRIVLPGGGVVWATEDPAIAVPVLNVAGPEDVAVSDDGKIEAVRFDTYTNYADYVQRWELLLYNTEDDNFTRPVAKLEGPGAPAGSLVWTAGSLELEPGSALVYVLRVYDDQGRFDETVPRDIRFIHEVDRSEDEATGIYGISNLGRQSIPLNGSRVRIHGAEIDPENSLRIDGVDVPVDQDGRFAAEMIKPAGNHDLTVETVDAAGHGSTRNVPVEVTGKYFFMVGMADLTVGQNSLSGSLESLEGDEHYDGDVFVDGRIAFYLKGKVKGRYLITARLDTGEDELGNLLDNLSDKDPRRVFRQLDPDRYYPVYGDDSTTYEDAASQGNLYVRVDWDRSSAVLGNFATGFTGTEFSQYNRTLYGAGVDYRSPEITTFGEDRLKIRGFASEAQTASGHVRFEGTGGSLYYLRDNDIVLGSEKLAVEVLERDSGRVIDNVVLQRGRDYEIDELQGRILLNRPLSSIAAQVAPSMIKDTPLDGNRVYLVADYEYIPTGFNADDVSFGVRGKGWAGDHLGIGATYVQEDRAGQDYSLIGTDLTWRHDAGTYIKAEYAQTDATQNGNGWLSSDGGLTFQTHSAALPGVDRSGAAYGVETRMSLGEMTAGGQQGDLAAWWRTREAGFSTARLDSGIETTEYGAEANWKATDTLSLGMRGAVVDRTGITKDTALSVQADYRLNDKLVIGAEGRRVEEKPNAGTAASGTLGAVRVNFKLNPLVDLYGIAQFVMQQDDSYRDNDMATVGARTRIGKLGNLRAEISAGDRGNALTLGAERNIGDRHQVYGTATLSTDSTDLSRSGWSLGQRSTLSNQLTVFTENRFVRGLSQAGLGHVFGLDFRPDDEWQFGLAVETSETEQTVGLDIERDAVSVSVGHQGEATRWNSRLEFREDGGSVDRVQWLTTNRVDHRIGESMTLFGKLSLSFTEDQDLNRDDARFIESGVGFAWRPVAHDRWNVLGRYTYLYDLPTPEQVLLRTDQKSSVLSAEALYDLNRRWELGMKLARRISEIRTDRDAGDWFENDANLAMLRGRYHLIDGWDGLAEYRRLWSDESEDARSGFLVGVDRHIGDHMKLGVGYNFTDFTDDLTDLNYDGHGWFINVTGKY